MKKCRLLPALLCLLLLAGCGRTEADQVHTEAVMVDGVLYHSTGKQLPGEVDESAVLGTTSYTDGIPTEDGQANFSPDTGAEYAVTADGLVVCLDHEWTLLCRRNEPPRRTHHRHSRACPPLPRRALAIGFRRSNAK